MGNWKSRKLWLAIVGAFVAFGNAYWTLGMTVEQVMLILTPILVYIGVEGIKDIKTA